MGYGPGHATIISRAAGDDTEPGAATVAINDAGPTRIDLEGLTESQVNAIDLAEPTQEMHSSPMPSPSGRAMRRATCAIRPPGRFALLHGGYERLLVTRA